MRVEVYPVGWCAVLLYLFRAHVRPHPEWMPDRVRKARQHTHSQVRTQLRTTIRHLRRRQWRDLKNEFNGYLAEPDPFPEGVHRCGSGWTRKRALRSLRRQVRRPGVRWEAIDREIVKAMGGGA